MPRSKKGAVRPRKHPTSRARTPEDQQRVIDNIINAARELFEEEGYEAVNMRRVAVKAGYTAGAIYNYFSTKRQLLITIWEKDTWESYYAAKAGLIGGSKPSKKLKRVFRAYAEYWVSHPSQFRNLFGTRDRLDKPDDTYFHQSEVIKALFELFEKAVADALAEIGAELDPITEYLALFNFIQGVLDMRLLMGPKHPWPDLDQLIDIAVDGQLARWREIAARADTGNSTPQTST